MTINDHHHSGQSFDDALALIAAAKGQADAGLLRAVIRPTADDPARVVALLEMLAVLASGFVEALAEVTDSTSEEWLHGVALRERLQREHGE